MNSASIGYSAVLTYTAGVMYCRMKFRRMSKKVSQSSRNCYLTMACLSGVMRSRHFAADHKRTQLSAIFMLGIGRIIPDLSVILMFSFFCQGHPQQSCMQHVSSKIQH
ncbi:hypothetical protein V1517DRAFT_322788 [Lipomyces orientalis]|uniref:Uncharacterized protein n=1 Tax=Lipomyces orientalis TaxID=1233043 RepID=A0ACC3TP43_9ASCO